MGTALLRPPVIGCRAALLALVSGAAMAAGPSGSASAPQSTPISPAEQLIFNDAHLARIQPPAELKYRYVERGGKSGDVTDDVTIRLVPGAEGKCCTASGSYLSGARRLALPDVPEARANPVLLYFLEQQVRQLQAATGGQSVHFRRRIRLALAGGPPIEPTTISWEGRDVPARRITIKPYLDDPQRHRFEAQAGTSYTFVLSDAVPGMVYQLGAAIVGAEGASPTQQTLTLVPPAAARK
jgi:hypothetical protein